MSASAWMLLNTASTSWAVEVQEAPWMSEGVAHLLSSLNILICRDGSGPRKLYPSKGGPRHPQPTFVDFRPRYTPAKKVVSQRHYARRSKPERAGHS